MRAHVLHSLALALSLMVFLLSASAPQVATEGPTRFETIDLLLDPGGRALAAWQVRLIDPSGRTRIVGIEGGEDPAFAEPPYYDPAALAGGALVLAAFHTASAGPDIETRVARLHFEVQGDAPVELDLTVEVAASADGPFEDARCRLLTR